MTKGDMEIRELLVQEVDQAHRLTGEKLPPNKPTSSTMRMTFWKMVVLTVVSSYPFYAVVDKLSGLEESDFVPCNRHVCLYIRMFPGGGLGATHHGFVGVRNGHGFMGNHFSSVEQYGLEPCLAEQCPRGGNQTKIDNFLATGASKRVYLLGIAGWTISKIIHDGGVMYEWDEDKSMNVGFLSWCFQMLAACAGIFWCMGAVSVFQAPVPGQDCACYYRLPGLQAFLAISAPFLLLYMALEKLKAIVIAAKFGDYLYFKQFDVPFRYLQDRNQWASATFVTEFTLSDVESGTTKNTREGGCWYNHLSGGPRISCCCIFLLITCLSPGSDVLIWVTPGIVVRAVELLGGDGSMDGVPFAAGLCLFVVSVSSCALVWLVCNRWAGWSVEFRAPGYRLSLGCCEVRSCCCCLPISPRILFIFYRFFDLFTICNLARITVTRAVTYFRTFDKYGNLEDSATQLGRIAATSVGIFFGLYMQLTFWNLFEDLLGVGQGEELPATSCCCCVQLKPLSAEEEDEGGADSADSDE